MRLKGIELMESLGGWDTLRTLEEISLGFHTSTPPLRRLAAETFLRLRARLEAMEKGERLLRSSRAPLNPDSLVRPATGEQELSPKELLRPMR